MQIEKIRKLNQCDMEDINAVSTLASKMGLRGLLTMIDIDSNKYLEYIKKKRS